MSTDDIREEAFAAISAGEFSDNRTTEEDQNRLVHLVQLGLRAERGELIDPQRLVNLAKRYTDEGKAGWVELVFRDVDESMWLTWSINTPNWEAEYEGESAADVLKEAEA